MPFTLFREDAYQAAAQPKDLTIIPNASDFDLYGRLKFIPFGKLERFFRQNLNSESTVKATELNER
jgi:uncharacterized protein